jgi:hypothetical protein
VGAQVGAHVSIFSRVIARDGAFDFGVKCA